MTLSHLSSLLKPLTDLDAIWQVCLRQVGVSDPQGRGDFGGQTPSQNMQLQSQLNHQSCAATL